MTQNPDDWTFSIYVPGEPKASSDDLNPPQRKTDASTDHSLLQSFQLRMPRIVPISGAAMRQQWSETVANLLKLTAAVSEQAGQWQIDEIEVGFTLSAKGELLFIAEAGAEASVKFKLTRKPAPVGPARP